MAAFESLRENKDFRTLYYHGRSQVHPALVTYVRKNRLGYPRVGITTGKKLGGAAWRRHLDEPASAPGAFSDLRVDADAGGGSGSCRRDSGGL